MRTTPKIDDKLLAAAKCVARERGRHFGRMLSEWVLRGLLSRRSANVQAPSGSPVVVLPEDAQPITLEEVRRQEDEP
jgi:hypothetical protein